MSLYTPCNNLTQGKHVPTLLFQSNTQLDSYNMIKDKVSIIKKFVDITIKLTSKSILALLKLAYKDESLIDQNPKKKRKLK
jgi:hypothetical protein